MLYIKAYKIYRGKQCRKGNSYNTTHFFKKYTLAPMSEHRFTLTLIIIAFSNNITFIYDIA